MPGAGVKLGVQRVEGFVWHHMLHCRMIAVLLQHCTAKCFIASPANNDDDNLRVATVYVQVCVCFFLSLCACVCGLCPALRLVGIPLHFIMAKHAFIMLASE